MDRRSPVVSGAGLALVALVALGSVPGRAAADEAPPSRWEQLFFPFPIVGAPPQLEQQVQLFESLFTGTEGRADVVSAELAYIASPHVGLVLTVPFQIGVEGPPTGLQDVSVLAQYLAAGSLAHDDMLSVGLQANLPTGRGDLGAGDAFAGPFAYGAQRFLHHLVLEGNLTALLPLLHSASASQLAANALVAVLVDRPDSGYPVYLQVEVDSTTFLSGSAALPPLATHTPAWTAFVAPEVFVGPFRSPIGGGTRIAAGVFFALAGDPVHARTYTVTAAFDIPNRYGY